MIRAVPFRALLYDLRKVSSLGDVLSPPWDLLDETTLPRYTSRSPYNIAHLIYRGIEAAQACARLREWVREGVLVPDSGEAVYTLRHFFSLGERRLERRGAFALLDLDKESSPDVIPHEMTFSTHIENRYRLAETCKASFDPVFVLYEDRNNTLDRFLATRNRVLASGSFDKQEIVLGRMEGQSETAEFLRSVCAGKLYIADGHHRYRAASELYRDRPAPETRFLLVYLSNLHAPELVIHPTHRYIPGVLDMASGFPEIRRYFSVSDAPDLPTLLSAMESGGAGHRFGIWHDGRFYLLTLRDEEAVLPSLPEGRSRMWRLLDGVILHEFILRKLLGYRKDTYFYDPVAERLLARARAEQGGAVFFLNAVRKEEFRTIVENGEMLPQKSTYFFPKVPSGLLVYRLPETP